MEKSAFILQTVRAAERSRLIRDMGIIAVAMAGTALLSIDIGAVMQDTPSPPWFEQAAIAVSMALGTALMASGAVGIRIRMVRAAMRRADRAVTKDMRPPTGAFAASTPKGWIVFTSDNRNAVMMQGKDFERFEAAVACEGGLLTRASLNGLRQLSCVQTFLAGRPHSVDGRPSVTWTDSTGTVRSKWHDHGIETTGEVLAQANSALPHTGE